MRQKNNQAFALSWNEILAKSTISFGFCKSHTIKNFQLVQSYFL